LVWPQNKGLTILPIVWGSPEDAAANVAYVDAMDAGQYLSATRANRVRRRFRLLLCTCTR